MVGVLALALADDVEDVVDALDLEEDVVEAEDVEEDVDDEDVEEEVSLLVATVVWDAESEPDEPGFSTNIANAAAAPRTATTATMGTTMDAVLLFGAGLKLLPAAL